MGKPETTLKPEYRDKKLVIFDLDGVLVETKSVIDTEMSELVTELLRHKMIAIIGGGKYELFQSLLVSKLNCPEELLKNLFLFPTTGTAFYKYQNGWQKVYSKELSGAEKNTIKNAIADALKSINYVEPEKTYGNTVEDRETEISWSALGQDVVTVLGEKGVKLKEEWQKKHSNIKLKLTEILQKLLPNFEVHAAGYTTIDITPKGIDKEYGIRQMEKYLKIPLADMIFIGDALFPEGNDYAALRTGIPCVAVKNPEETKKIITFLLQP